MSEQFMRVGGTDGQTARPLKTDTKGNLGVHLNASVDTSLTPQGFEIPANGRVMVGSEVKPDGTYGFPLDISNHFKALIVVNSSDTDMTNVSVDIFQSVKDGIGYGSTRVFNKSNYQDFVEEGVRTRYFEIPLLGEDMIIRLSNTTEEVITMNKVIIKLF